VRVPTASNKPDLLDLLPMMKKPSIAYGDWDQVSFSNRSNSTKKNRHTHFSRASGAKKIRPGVSHQIDRSFRGLDEFCCFLLHF